MLFYLALKVLLGIFTSKSGNVHKGRVLSLGRSASNADRGSGVGDGTTLSFYCVEKFIISVWNNGIVI